MTTNSIPLADLEAGNSAKFERIGDKHAGKIVAMDERQQTSMAGIPLTFNDGSPRTLWVITIEPDDGDPVQLWAKGGKFKAKSGTGESMLVAIGLAVKAAGAESVDLHGELAVAYTGDGEPTTTGGTPKLYTAQYLPPAPSIPAMDLLSKP